MQLLPRQACKSALFFSALLSLPLAAVISHVTISKDKGHERLRKRKLSRKCNTSSCCSIDRCGVLGCAGLFLLLDAVGSVYSGYWSNRHTIVCKVTVVYVNQSPSRRSSIRFGKHQPPTRNLAVLCRKHHIEGYPTCLTSCIQRWGVPIYLQHLEGRRRPIPHRVREDLHAGVCNIWFEREGPLRMRSPHGARPRAGSTHSHLRFFAGTSGAFSFMSGSMLSSKNSANSSDHS